MTDSSDDVDTGRPLTHPMCVATGQHMIVYGKICYWCDSTLGERSFAADDDDRGDVLVRQSGGIRRDRWKRAVR